MSETHRGYVETELETPFGVVILRCHGADHIDLDAHARNINAPESRDYFPGVVVNRVPLSVRMQFYRRAEDDVNTPAGTFGLGKEDRGRYADGAFSTSKVNDTTYRDTYSVSWAAREKLERVLVPLVNEWAESEGGIAVLQEAGEALQLREIEQAQGKVAAAQKALDEAKSELDRLVFPGARASRRAPIT